MLGFMSVTIVTGNATFPNTSSNEIEAVNTTSTEKPYDHVRTALIAIVAGALAFITIVGNIMVSFKIIDLVSSNPLRLWCPSR